nr:MAG TPA: hypothetical protein [Caudoviricetes sp.]
MVVAKHFVTLWRNLSFSDDFIALSVFVRDG